MQAGEVVGVVGAGTMGAGIAEVAARSGHPVLLLDVDPGAAARAVAALRTRLERDVTAARLTQQDCRAVAARVTPAGTLQGLAAAGLVVEAASESLTLKRDLFASLEAVVPDDAVLATNTSSLSVTAIASGLRHPGRVIGLHFFNPAPRMQLVEVVRGDATDDDVAAGAAALVRAWGKTPVACTSTPGFIVNRVARPFYGEAQRIAEERVADPATVDLVLREAGGFVMGPFELTDLVGQDVNLAVSRSVWEQTFHDPRYAPTVLQQRLVDAGRLGRKTRRGVFRYGDEVHQQEGHRPRPRSAPRQDAPATVMYREGWSVMAPLLKRIVAGGVQVLPIDPPDRPHGDDDGLLLPSGGRLVETRGRRAVDVGADVIVLDWAFDPARTRRVAVAAAAGACEATLGQACGVLQAAGLEVTVVGDGPGVVVARTVAMLVNEAADLVAREEASATDVDLAMRLGTSYPAGPLEWGDLIGTKPVVQVLERLQHAFPSGRYRVAGALRVAAETGGSLRV